MRHFAAIFLIQAVAAFASQIDLALIQFPETKTAEELNEALVKANLAEITNSNRTMTKERALQNGTVLFTQTISSSNLASSTRLENLRADVSGSYKNGRLEVEITLSEGVEAGLRSFTKRTYQGSAELPSGTTRVISLRQIVRKNTVAEKGRIEVRESETTTAIIARAR
ncbi:MAG: hypothetical protein ACO3FQ_03255 [Terrimicrobiaceae bacterium]